MRYDTSLRLARGAGRVQHIGGIVCRHAGQSTCLIPEGLFWCLACTRPWQAGFPRKHQTCRTIAQEMLATSMWQGLIQGQIHEASPQNAQKAGVRLNTAWQCDAYHGVWRHGKDKIGGKTCTGLVKICVGSSHCVRGGRIISILNGTGTGLDSGMMRWPLTDVDVRWVRRWWHVGTCEQRCRHIRWIVCDWHRHIVGIGTEDGIHHMQEHLSIGGRHGRIEVVQDESNMSFSCDTHFESQGVLDTDTKVCRRVPGQRMLGRSFIVIFVHLKYKKTHKQRLVTGTVHLLSNVRQRHRCVLLQCEVRGVQLLNMVAHGTLACRIHTHRQGREQWTTCRSIRCAPSAKRHDIAQQNVGRAENYAKHSSPSYMGQGTHRRADMGRGLFKRTPRYRRDGAFVMLEAPLWLSASLMKRSPCNMIRGPQCVCPSIEGGLFGLWGRDQILKCLTPGMRLAQWYRGDMSIHSSENHIERRRIIERMVHHEYEAARGSIKCREPGRTTICDVWHMRGQRTHYILTLESANLH